MHWVKYTRTHTHAHTHTRNKKPNIYVKQFFSFAELNVRESDVRVCDESSCKYGGVCKEDGDGLKCACQFQVRKPSLFWSFIFFVFYNSKFFKLKNLKHLEPHKEIGVTAPQFFFVR